MFSDVLLIKPKLDDKDLAGIERSLSGRFNRVAKKFGGGLISTLKSGALLSVATTLIDKVLNPLKEVQEAIDKTLSRGDDLATYAAQFETTAGNLARLQAFGRATGLDPEGVRMLLGKFQASVARATVDPSKESAVSAFVGRTDTAESFFEFVQSMQKLDAVSRSLVQQEVFGEKQILKASEFLNADFAKLTKLIGGPSAQELTVAINKISESADKSDIMAAGRENTDLVNKSKLIGDNTILGIEQGIRKDLERENKRLANFDDLKKISMATDKMVKSLEDAYLTLAPVLGQLLPKLVQVADLIIQNAPAVKASRFFRGLGNGKDND